MRRALVLIALTPLSLLAACGNGGDQDAPVDDAAVADGDDATADGGTSCPPCTDESQCGGGACAQLGADSVCLPRCPVGNECDSDRKCETITDTAGSRTPACVPRTDVCGTNPSADAGPPGDSSPPPADAPPPPPPTDAGPVTGTIGPKGGKVSRLFFAAVGDTRPPLPDDTKGYPTAVITKIWSDVASLSPRPAFAVSTGDYVFATTFGSQAAAQLDLYLGARAKYPDTLFPALGNHECTGSTSSNCGPGTANGVTKNYQAFLDKMLVPLGLPNPWYSIRIDGTDGSWTSKFVFVAPNAWTAAQATWLDAALSEKTTYTFIVRHEPAEANTAPGTTPSETIIAKHPYTLKIVGHTHTYEHKGYAHEVVFGNGGAPLAGSAGYGFGLFSQRSDGAIQVDALDYASLAYDLKFRFAVKADGTPAP